MLGLNRCLCRLRRLRLLLRAADELHLEHLGARLPLLRVDDQEAVDQRVDGLRVPIPHRLRERRLVDRAEPLHEEEGGLAVRVPVAQEVGVDGLQDGIERDQLADGHADTPAVQRRVDDDRVVLDEELRPLGGAVARREGDGRVLDGHLAAPLHAAVDVDQLQPAVEHHEVLGLHVDVHEALGVQAGRDEDHRLGDVLHG
mmetsp:Transcript_1781/g.3552  ORF Transcript_1781/g.3552 Transcript_1781/m.3552 type:complete len:200 (-) Transcript_1781:687-1286(-)